MASTPNAIYSNRLELETASRNACRMAYLGNNLAIARVLERFTIWIDTRDTSLAPHLCLDGFWESWVTLAMIRIIQPGWHCIDVGANLGYYMVVMANGVGPGGRVLAVEPNPQLHRILNRTIQVNGIGGMTTLSDRALSDADDQETRLVIPLDSGLNGSILRVPEGQDQSFQVKTATLDTIAEGLGQVDLVKIDAEGSEQQIWKGGRRTLRLNPRIIVIMEINCVRYADPAAFLAEIEAEGFPLRFIDWDGSIQPITAEQIATERPFEDLMLYLQRP